MIFAFFEPRESCEHWKVRIRSPQFSTNVIGAFQGYIGKSMKQKNIFCISPFSNNWIHIFAPKPMTIVNFNFILCSIFIIKNWNASLVIVIGFGAKIWIQSPNLFQKFQQVWRQLHSLSIVDYPNFQCSRLFLGILIRFL